MTPKRRLSSPGPSSEPPHKRRHTSSFPSSSYPPYPSDSPSNPFGRTRTWNLLQALPPPTSFSKHLPLRFQYVKRGAPRATLDGVYRVVQVPQSYTLVHLKSLICFLFGGAYGQIPPTVEEEEAAPPYMFEIKKGVTLYSPSYKPGQIKKGNTWAYSSGMLDPYLYYPDSDPEVEDDDEEVREPSPQADEPVDERKWTAEEDITVAHVWPEGGDVTRGILYQHTPDLSIHITINTMPIATRRGKGNLPHVFLACGLVYMEEPAEEDELEAEDPAVMLDPSNWNEPEEAFSKYYGRHTLLPFMGYEKEAGADTDAEPEAPSLTFSSSSPLRSSSSLATSPSSSHDHASIRIFGSSPSHFPKYTPAPRPAQRKRIRHLQERIGNLTRASVEDLKIKRKKKERARSVEL